MYSGDVGHVGIADIDVEVAQLAEEVILEG